jgi:hypothetical protein
MHNRTLDFKKVFDELEPLCFSHALIVLNKDKIIRKLLGYLEESEHAGSEASAAMQTHDTVVKGKVLELLIALVKDLRQDIYRDFKE